MNIKIEGAHFEGRGLLIQNSALMVAYMMCAECGHQWKIEGATIRQVPCEKCSSNKATVDIYPATDAAPGWFK